MEEFLAQVASMRASLATLVKPEQGLVAPSLLPMDNDNITIMGSEGYTGVDLDAHDFKTKEEEIDAIVHACGDIYDSILEILESHESDDNVRDYLRTLVGTNKPELVRKMVAYRADICERDHILKQQANYEAVRKANEEANANLQQGHDPDQYPHVYTTESFGHGNMLTAFGTKYTLPAGTTRYQGDYYEEVDIPYPSKSYKGKVLEAMNVPLIDISSLDFLCRGTFSKYETLNRMQTLVYSVAYQSNENMLVCAPTGAGKTDVALLTMLHTIHQHSQYPDGENDVPQVNYDDFKIVYVAPLKALAAEIVEKMSSRLSWLDIKVRELTGDMQLTRQELAETQIIVTTPEKWDVVTRKSSTTNDELVSKVKLLIIDEVHLLHEDRGSVIESLVARTLRQVERSQSLIRIVGLSATLPNYLDVAEFLRVNPQVGLFFFDSSFRPIPLKQEFVAVKAKARSFTARSKIDQICYEKLMDQLRQGYQVMIFVHSRKDTVSTARSLTTLMQQDRGFDHTLMDCSESPQYEKFAREMTKFKNRDMKELFQNGFGVHHAGLTRHERNQSEKMFATGAVKVLCCTATLAWGVNLPAAVVIIKGTEMFDPQRGGFVDLGISDVIQIFGRAGRPQFEKFGTGILITTSDKLSHYLSLITEQHPIESKLQPKIADNLNAEIALGSVTNVDEGVQWLGYTYLQVRMKKSPFQYGMTWQDIADDPNLAARRRKLIVSAAQRLHELQMIVYDPKTDIFISKDIGRIASDFYLLNSTIEVFNSMMNSLASEADMLAMISMSDEFSNIKTREDELEELQKIYLDEKFVKCQIATSKDDKKGMVDNPSIKTNILLQSYISRAYVKVSSLASDSMYVAQNASRIARALFLLSVNRRWGHFSRLALMLCQAIDRQLWWFDDHPLAQFNDLNTHTLQILNAKQVPISSLKEMSNGELGDLVHNSHMGSTLGRLIDRFPLLDIDRVTVQPITSKVLRVHLKLIKDFKWDSKYHGNAGMLFWVWVEDSEDYEMLHVEKAVLTKTKDEVELDFTIPLPERKVSVVDDSGDEKLVNVQPKQLIVRVLSENWIGSEAVRAVSFKHLITPETETVVTKLLRLRPLPKEALHNEQVKELYRFDYFNPMQTMVFHSIYHGKSSILLGSPTGSGKTIACELAIWANFRDHPGSKVVYIAPMKALVRERVDDWAQKFKGVVKVVEMTGDTNPEAHEIRQANIIITTPEKFDGLSRNWQTRKFIQQVKLIIMDEVHLLASDRGAILEMIVSRMRMSIKSCPRLMGMSTAVANPTDLANWLGVEDNRGLFNFPPSVRPVPLQMYIDGFPDAAFSPFMNSMNKPAFSAIKRHSLGKPVLVFVPSRRQTRMTAQDFINMCAAEEDPRRFVRMDDNELASILTRVHDDTLKSALQFGIAVHHAGLVDSDRRIAHELFANNKVQVLIATSTLAWGVNLPAYLVIVKGTHFFDQKKQGYKDMDLTDVLQMMGRAGRPGFDDSGVACVFTKESTKSFYKYFLNSGFPVESSLHLWFADHLGAEISGGSIKSRQDAMNFLTSTFLFRRVHRNPSYYGVLDAVKGDDDDDDHEEKDEQEEEEIDTNVAVNKWFVKLIDRTLAQLIDSGCVVTTNSSDDIAPTKFLRIASYYYLSHKTMKMFLSEIKPDMDIKQALLVLAWATEYDELAIRHGEDELNEGLSGAKGIKFHGSLVNQPMVNPHVKAFLLVQSHIAKIPAAKLPIQDYVQDRVAVLDQALRILQAAIDTAAELGYLLTVLKFVELMHCIKNGTWNPQDAKSPSLVIKRDQSNQSNLVTLSTKSPFIVPCYFHKPQQQSWFIIHYDGNEIVSLTRYVPLKEKVIEIKGTTLIINDTKNVRYELDQSGVLE